MGADETGYRVAEKRWWMWVWHGEDGVYYAASPSRGYKVVKEHFGEDYQGVLLHDCWPAHNNTSASGGHQQCHPHLDRAAQFLIDAYESKWAGKIQDLLLGSQREREKIHAKGFPESLREPAIVEYENQLEELLNWELFYPEEIALKKRLKKHQASIFRFLRDPEIPFHNNGSERAIRMAKVRQKISGCHRSPHGARRQAVLLSVLETSKRHQKNLMESITSLFNNSLSFSAS